jgi:hypothetical protein
MTRTSAARSLTGRLHRKRLTRVTVPVRGEEGIRCGLFCQYRSCPRNCKYHSTTSIANQVSSSAATFLVESRGLAGDRLEIVAKRDVDDGAADALHAGIALVALPGGAEEQTASYGTQTCR